MLLPHYSTARVHLVNSMYYIYQAVLTSRVVDGRSVWIIFFCDVNTICVLISHILDHLDSVSGSSFGHIRRNNGTENVCCTVTMRCIYGNGEEGVG